MSSGPSLEIKRREIRDGGRHVGRHLGAKELKLTHVVRVVAPCDLESAAATQDLQAGASSKNLPTSSLLVIPST